MLYSPSWVNVFAIAVEGAYPHRGAKSDLDSDLRCRCRSHSTGDPSSPGHRPGEITEVAEPFDISLNSVSKHIRILERAHVVRRGQAATEHISRSIRSR